MSPKASAWLGVAMFILVLLLAIYVFANMETFKAINNPCGACEKLNPRVTLCLGGNNAITGQITSSLEGNGYNLEDNANFNRSEYLNATMDYR